MITLQDYFGTYDSHPDATVQRREAADDLISKVNALLLEAEAAGWYEWAVNPKTHTQISGTHNGGFRPHDCPEGSPGSSHKQGRGCDVYDPQNKLDRFLSDPVLAKHGLYREHPDDTVGWTHLSDRAPGSGNRTFRP